MINHKHLREYIIRPVLQSLGVHSQAAEELLILTAAQESRMGYYLHQEGGGPALGIYQMEPATHDDIHDNFLAFKPAMQKAVMVHGSDAEHMIGNLWYATAMARMHYLRVPKALPAADDVTGLAMYWKQWYNTPKGHGTVIQAVNAYESLVR